jgi:hypothetical protein
MHLTNYSLNKFNENFVQNNSDSENGTSKRSLTWLWGWLEDHGVDHKPIWRNICDLIVKTLLSTQAFLARSYNTCKLSGSNSCPFTCFEILGFDVILTESFQPILLEVNHTPSFRMDSVLDERIKLGLIQDTLKLLNMNADDRQKYYVRTAAVSQVRLYGSTFSEGKGTRMAPQEDSTDTLWARHRKNESLNIGNYVLVYPTDEYPDQPTSGFQKMYELILDGADALFQVQGGHSSFYAALSNNSNDSTISDSFSSLNDIEHKCLREVDKEKGTRRASMSAQSSVRTDHIERQSPRRPEGNKSSTCSPVADRSRNKVKTDSLSSSASITPIAETIPEQLRSHSYNDSNNFVTKKTSMEHCSSAQLIDPSISGSISAKSTNLHSKSMDLYSSTSPYTINPDSSGLFSSIDPFPSALSHSAEPYSLPFVHSMDPYPLTSSQYTDSFEHVQTKTKKKQLRHHNQHQLYYNQSGSKISDLKDCTKSDVQLDPIFFKDSGLDSDIYRGVLEQEEGGLTKLTEAALALHLFTLRSEKKCKKQP